MKLIRKLTLTFFILFLLSSGQTFASPLSEVVDPLGGRFTNIGVIISRLIPSVLLIAGMLALLFIIWGGIRYMTSRGDPKAIDSARNILQTAVIGFVIILLSGVIYGLLAAVLKIEIFSLITPVYADHCFPGSTDIGCLLGEPFAHTFNSLADLFTAVIRFALMAAALIFFFIFIWGGFKYLSAGGDPKSADAARSTLTNAIIGLLIVVLSFVIVEVIIKVLGGPTIFL